jgi:predicted amidohydrolase YtcJ
LSDLLLINGNIATLDPLRPRAAAVAIRAGRFAAVGDDAHAREACAGAPRVIDLRGACVVPGLTDVHLHFRWYAEALHAVDVETTTLDDAMARVHARAEITPSGAWITGSGWNHNVWGAGALPDLRPLDKAAPRNPVALKAKSGHALWANSLALRKAGIGLDTADPEGGKIAHGPDGLPSGILLENAMDMVQAAIPTPSPAELADMMRAAQAELHRKGLTGIHDFDSSLAMRACQELLARGELALRVVKGIPQEDLGAAIGMGLRTGFGGELLTVGSVKMFADGALGSQTAWMLAPYKGSWSTGIATLTEEQMVSDIRRANAAGIWCAIHAIGDAACHVVLDSYERARTVPARNRIEHAQLLHPDDIARLGGLGIVASMQPVHATSDMLIAEKYWGARCAGGYAWKSLLDTGAHLAFGSDCPVESPDPLAGIHAAVTRRRGDGSPGPGGWRPEQRVSVPQALHAYTLGAAYAGGRESSLGSIEPGKLADLTILSEDIFRIDAHEIRAVPVRATMVGGVFVHGAP